jgi:spermidine/putrescine transport system permease protein
MTAQASVPAPGSAPVQAQAPGPAPALLVDVRAGKRAARIERLGERLVFLYTGLVFAFLFLPIIIVVVYSFNAGRHVTELTGFSTQWYASAWSDRFLMNALRNSLTIAAITAVLATLLGTASALAMDRLGPRARNVFELLTYVAIIVPGIVIGIATLIFIVTALDWLNPWLAFLAGGAAPELGLGAGSVIAAHTLFTMAIVNVLVRTRMRGMDRSLVEASEDLYATPWRTFVQVTFPQLLPAIVAGALLAFTFSFDDFIIAFFTSGQDQTVPIYLFASIRRGVSPEVNAIATVLLAVTILAMVLAGVVYRRGQRRSGPSAAVAGDAAVAGVAMTSGDRG